MTLFVVNLTQTQTDAGDFVEGEAAAANLLTTADACGAFDDDDLWDDDY